MSRLVYESEVIEASEENPSIDKQAWLNNLYVFEKLTQRFGTNVFLLGSKSGRFTGTIDDMALLEWNGSNLQGFDFGRKGGGKSVGAKNFDNQITFMYGKPSITFDRAGEYLSHAQPVKDAFSIQRLHAFGLQPLGYGEKQVNISPFFLGNEDITKWSIDLLDFYAIHPRALAKELIEKILGISADTESDASKWDAARRYLSEALNEEPRNFKQLAEYVQDINSQLSDSRKSVVLERKLEQLVENEYVSPKHRLKLKDLIMKRKVINIVTSLKMSKNIPLQIYEGIIHYWLYQWKKNEEIPQTSIISEEHNLVSNKGGEKNFTKEIYAQIATKERKISNIYYKITQLPQTIPDEELSMSDFMITTRPRDPKNCDVFRWINEDEKIKERVMNLRWDDESPTKQHGIVTPETFTPFEPMPCWSQYHKEVKQIWLVKPFKRKRIAF